MRRGERFWACSLREGVTGGSWAPAGRRFVCFLSHCSLPKSAKNSESEKQQFPFVTEWLTPKSWQWSKLSLAPFSKMKWLFILLVYLLIRAHNNISAVTCLFSPCFFVFLLLFFPACRQLLLCWAPDGSIKPHDLSVTGTCLQTTGHNVAQKPILGPAHFDKTSSQMWLPNRWQVYSCEAEAHSEGLVSSTKPQ